MEEMRRAKIQEAVKETTDVYDRLGLNMTEVEIVSRSQNVAAKVMLAKKQLEEEAEEVLERQQTTVKEKFNNRMPAIFSTFALVMSIISLFLRLYL